MPQMSRRFEATGFDIKPHKGSCNAIQGDLLCCEDIARAAEGMDAIVHMAGLICRDEQDLSIDLNVKATANVLQAAVETGVQRRVEGNWPDETDAQRVERQAMAIALRAVSCFVDRYAALAEQQAADEKDPKRRDELDTIAKTCRHLARGPARTLREATQLTWFAYLIECVENGESTAAFALGRFDQYLWPYWQADRDAGMAREAQAHPEAHGGLLVRSSGDY